MSPLLCVAITALLWPRVAYPALPPASTGSTRQANDAASSPEPARGAGPAPSEKGGGQESSWIPPVVRIGGSVAYNTSRSMGEGQQVSQQSLMTTLRAATDTYIWQPWFSQINGNIAATVSRDSSDGNSSFFGSNRTKSVALTGYGQLKLLPVSHFPFELHFDKTDSSVSNDLVAVEGYSGQRVGFTQQYLRPAGNMTFGFDRSTQDSESYGRDRQDSLRLNLSHSLEKHRFTFNGDRTENVRERTGESTSQNNLIVQHSYSPAAAVSIENMANISQSGYKLQGGTSETEIGQLSSVAFWRPADKPMTVTGSARLLSLNAVSSGNEFGPAVDARARNANLNLGMTYDLSRYAHLNASANVNATEAAGKRATGTNQTLGVNYQPEPKKIGNFHYNWGTSAALNNSTGGSSSATQLTLQLSHNISRHMQLGEDSALTLEFNQGLAAARQLASSNNTTDDGTTGDASPGVETQIATKHVSHGGSLSWSLSKEGGSAMVRLSASDSRALDGNQAFFQLINLQASSNLPTSGYTSWSGSLTIQAVRQGGNAIPGAVVSGNGQFMSSNQANGGFVTTSSSALTYQNGRLFGIRRLRYVSDLRLNSQALLPMLGGPQDQEMAAWENRVDYWIGRTQFRVNALLARVTVPTSGNAQQPGSAPAESQTRVNKSIMFSVSRSFGNM